MLLRGEKDPIYIYCVKSSLLLRCDNVTVLTRGADIISVVALFVSNDGYTVVVVMGAAILVLHMSLSVDRCGSAGDARRDRGRTAHELVRPPYNFKIVTCYCIASRSVVLLCCGNHLPAMS